MIRKIQNHEYLKRYDNMSADERDGYMKRVGEWVKNCYPCLRDKTDNFEARIQDAITASAGWNDAECQAFEEGAVLLSATASMTDTWLPDMLYKKAARRAVQKIIDVLAAVLSGGALEGIKQKGESAKTAEHTPYTVKASDSARVNAGIAKEALLQGAPFQDPADGHIAGGDNKGESKKEDVRGKMEDSSAISPQTSGITPARPNHIDQYVHLLPQKTQERAAKYGPLMRELDETREKERLLMDDPTASAKDREALAKRITAIDKEIRSIKKELDVEWEKLAKSGRVVVDDLGNARILPPQQGEEQQPASETPQAPVELTSEQKAKRRDLRKWLVDTRRGNGDTREEHVKKWKDNFKEYLTLEGDAAYADEKVKAAAEHYGIDMEEVRGKK